MAITVTLESLEAAKTICKQYWTAVQEKQVITVGKLRFHTAQNNLSKDIRRLM